MSKLMDLYLKAINEGSSLRFDSDKRVDEVRAVNTEETEQLDELSKETLKSYLKKSDTSFESGDNKTKQKRAKGEIAAVKKLERKANSDNPFKEETELNLEDFSLEELQDFMMSEDFEQLDEISKKTLGSYIRKANIAATEHQRRAQSDARHQDDMRKVSHFWSGKKEIDEPIRKATSAAIDHLEKTKQKNIAKSDKRERGIERAVKHLTKEETELDEEMTQAQMDKREKYVKGMKKKYKDFVSKYGARAKDVMYATATKMAMKEEVEEIEEDLNLEDFSLEELQDFMMSEDFEQLDELSKATLDSYIDKATKTRQKHSGTSYAADLSDGIRKAKAKAKIKFHNGEDDGHKGVTEELDQVNEEITYFTEGMISHGDFMDKVDGYKKAGINVVSHKHDDNHAHIVTVDKEGTKRKINFKPSGTSMENLGKVEDGKKPKAAEPEVKRGRGRPAGSKSGARTNDSDKKEYGGLAIHSLNLPKSK